MSLPPFQTVVFSARFWSAAALCRFGFFGSDNASRNRRSPSQVLVLACLCIPILSLPACVTKSEAKNQARNAYMAGEQAALARIARAHESVVTFIGPVQFPTVQWTQNLTLAKAIVSAGYTGPAEPSQIMIVRGGQAIPIDPKRLLSGEDIPLLSGDLVQISQ